MSLEHNTPNSATLEHLDTKPGGNRGKILGYRTKASHRKCNKRRGCDETIKFLEWENENV